jgi:hypothetical protein
MMVLAKRWTRLLTLRPGLAAVALLAAVTWVGYRVHVASPRGVPHVETRVDTEPAYTAWIDRSRK